MIYHFDHAVPREENSFIEPVPEFSLPELKAIVSRWDKAIGNEGWQNSYFGNHDNPRVMSRFGNPTQYPYQSATMLAMVLLTQRGTPSIYQGDELGMTNCLFDSIEEYDDIQVKNAWQALVLDKHYPAARFLQAASRIARDHARTPMQWSDMPNAGFTTGTPWLKVNPNYNSINVNQQDSDGGSVLAYYRKLLHWRKNTSAMHEGSYQDLLPNHLNLWIFERKLNRECYQIVASFSADEVSVPSQLLDKLQPDEVVLSNYQHEFDNVLRPFEARIYYRAEPA